jgi:hypothetical protein
MKRIYILIIILIVLLLIASYLIFVGRPGIYKGMDNEFAIRDTASIRLIEIRSSENIIILERQEGQWMINRQFPASSRRVKGLLTLISRLKINSVVPAPIRNEIMKRLEDDGKRLMIMAGRRNPYVTFMYHDTVHTNATYMMAEHSDHIFRIEVPGFRNRNIAGLFVDEINYWRDHKLFHLKPDEINSISLVDRKNPENSFYLIINDPGHYELFTNPDSNQIPDPNTETIEQYLGYFASVSFEQFLSSNDYDAGISFRDEDVRKIITVSDSRNHDTEVKTFTRYVKNRKGIPEPDLNRLYAVMNKTDTVLAKYVELDPVMKEIGYFLNQEKK